MPLDSPAPPSPGKLTLLFAGFLAVAVAASQPLSGSAVLAGNADAVLGAWDLSWICSGFLHPADTFYGNMFHPDRASLLFAEPLVGIGLLSAPFCFAGVDPVTFHNLAYVLTLAMGALGAWLLSREVSGSGTAALVGGVVFAFTSANYDSAARLQIVASQWTPICLTFLIRFCRQGRLKDAVFMALAFSMQALSCTYYEIFLAVLLVLTIPWWVRLAGGAMAARSRLMGSTVAVLVVAATVLPQNLWQRQHLAPVLSARAPAQSLSLSTFTDVLPTNLLYSGWLGRSSVAYDDLYFPGLVPLLLAALFLGLWLRSPETRRSHPALAPLMAVGAIAFGFSFGQEVSTRWGTLPGPLSVIPDWVPGLAQARVPARFLMFSRLTLAVLAACGTRWLIARIPRRAFPAAILLAGVCVLEHWSTPLDAWRAPTKAEWPAVYSWLETPGNVQGAIIEFPPAVLRLRREEAAWLHTAAGHRAPMVNGYSSFRPAWFEYVMESALARRPAEFFRILSLLDARTLVLHPRKTDIPEMDRATQDLLQYAERHPAEIRQVASFSDPRRLEGIWSRLGDERVFTISAVPVHSTAIGPALPRVGWSCRSSEPSCERAFDGDSATLVRGREAQAEGQFLRIRFDRPATIEAVSIDMGRFAELFPRDVRLRFLGADGWQERAAEFQIEPFLGAMLRGSTHPSMIWTFAPVTVDGFEIRLATGGQGFRELGIPEIHAHARVAAHD